jgi:hypothetical protein
MTGLGGVWVAEFPALLRRAPMANGSVYRRDDRKKPWFAHIAWHEGERRRQSKKSYATKREAKSALAEAIDAHRRQEFVAPTVIRLRDFFVTWIDSLETQGRKVSTIEGYRKTMRRYVLATFLNGEETINVPKTKRCRRTIDLDQRTASVLKQHRATVSSRTRSVTRCVLPLHR